MMLEYPDGTLWCCDNPVYWVDCDKHEPESEGCYRALCEVCDNVDRDCEAI